MAAQLCHPLAQYGTRDTGFEGGFAVDDTLVDTLTSPVETYNKTKDQVLQGIEEYKKTTIGLYNDAGELIQKTGNYLDDKGFKTDEEVKAEEAEKARQEAEAERKRLEEERNRIIPVLIGDREIERVKAGGVPGSDEPPINQHTLESKASGTACTFSVWTMIAGYFGVAKSLNDTYKDAPNSVVDKETGWVYSQEGIIEAAGVPDIKVTTYNIRDAGESTQIMVDSLNDGGKIHLRVAPGNTGGHSVVVDSYAIDNDTGKLYMNVRDPDSNNKYNYYDPEAKQLFNIENKGKENEKRVYDDRRKLLRFETAEKKN